MLTHYDVLNVDPGAELEAVRRAWRLKVRLLHPDRHRDSPYDVQAEAARETVRVNKAWDTLGDPDKRHEYDADLGRLREAELAREQAEPSDSQSVDEDEHGPVWLSSPSYLGIASFLIVVVATAFVIAGAVLLAQLTH